MNEGKSFEVGKHEDLLKNESLYKEIYDTQVAQDQGAA